MKKKYMIGALLLLPTGAIAKPSVVAPPLVAGQGVPANIAKQFDATLRKALAQKGVLASLPGTLSALKQAGNLKCATDACGKILAKASNSRFVIGAVVSAADEIYQVKLSVFDSARNERSAVIGTCELCTAGEVHGTIQTAVGKLQEKFTKQAAPAAPPPATLTMASFTSIPPGAKVLVDGIPKGSAPVKVKLKAGKHSVQFTKEGYLAQSRTLEMGSRPISLGVRLIAEKKKIGAPVAAVIAAPVPATVPPIIAPVAVKAAVPTDPSLPGKYNHLGWGMTIGGIALAGVGTWLIVLDGDITCDDGRGRETCPNVYNTKGVGIAGLGIGATLIGAAVAIFAVGPDADAVQAGFGPLPGGGAAVQWGGQF